MALVRILVDGYSLLHSWPELAPGRPRHSAAARDELVRILTLYQDATGTPVTVFFDGSFPRRQAPANGHAAAGIEVLFSRAGKTADEMIERTAHRLLPYGEVLAVTDDHLERDTVMGLGGLAASCANFIQSIEGALADLANEIKHHNRQESRRFNRRPDSKKR